MLGAIFVEKATFSYANKRVTGCDVVRVRRWQAGRQAGEVAYIST